MTRSITSWATGPPERTVLSTNYERWMNVIQSHKPDSKVVVKHIWPRIFYSIKANESGCVPKMENTWLFWQTIHCLQFFWKGSTLQPHLFHSYLFQQKPQMYIMYHCSLLEKHPETHSNVRWDLELSRCKRYTLNEPYCLCCALSLSCSVLCVRFLCRSAKA